MQNAATDHTDHLLREFFRRELPHPWPPPRLPALDSPPKPMRRRGLHRGHLSLAASLGFLVVGLGLASELLRGTNPGPAALPDNVLPGEAKRPGGPLRIHKPPATTPEESVAPPVEEDRKPFGSLLLPRPR